MKKFLLLAVFSLVISSLSAQIKVNSSGKVGINNTSPSYQLDVSGNFRVDDGSYTILFNYGDFYPNGGSSSLGTYSYKWYEIWGNYAYFSYSPIITSDLNMKTDVRDMAEVKDKFSLLRPVVYKLKEDKTETEETKKKVDDQYGLIAQEVRELFPDIVTENEEGTLGIRYTELIPVLIKMIQYQQGEIESLEDEISKIKNK